MITGFQQYKELFHLKTAEGIQLGNEQLLAVLARLGNPQKKINAVHLAGTNGKGSTLQFLKFILLEAGYSVGSFTSPCLVDVHEQISVGVSAISREEMILTIEEILEKVGNKKELEGITDFELLTVIALYYFSTINPQEIVLMETGMGGEEDSTNVILPQLSIITNIGLDHVHFLGNSLTSIARHKAGIIKKNVAVITAVKQQEAKEVIEGKAKEKNAPLFSLGENFFIKNRKLLQNGEGFTFGTEGSRIENIEISMLGEHQIENASLAIMASLLLKEKLRLKVSKADIKAGIKKAVWPGRFEVISTNPYLIVDGAHNEEGVETLVNELTRRFPKRNKRFIFAALGDKSLARMIEKMESIAEQITFVDFNFPRAAKAEELLQLSTHEKKKTHPVWADAILEEIVALKKEDILVITGSLYFLSEIKPFLKEILSK